MVRRIAGRVEFARRGEQLGGSVHLVGRVARRGGNHVVACAIGIMQRGRAFTHAVILLGRPTHEHVAVALHVAGIGQLKHRFS